MKLTIAAILVVITTIFYVGYLSEKDWAEFKVAHKCKVTAHITGDVVPVLSMDGKMGFGSTPDKTGHTCDDGITYYR